MDASFYNNFITGLAAQENQIATLQQQISTGSTATTAAQNPTAYETATLANDQISQLTDDATTQGNMQTQLGAATSAYSAMSSLLDNVQSVVLQGLNGTASAQNLNAIATQVQSASQQLLALGNTQAPNGSYLFGGSRGGVMPFQANSSGTINYYGDSAQSQATIGSGITANTLVNGSVFTSALAGDGTSVVSANSTNQGTGQILQQGIMNVQAAEAFQQSSTSTPIVVTFTVADGKTTYSASQVGNNTPLATGTLNTASGATTTLQVAGTNYAISGHPADGDTFSITPARPQSAFSLLQTITNDLNASRSTPAQVAKTNQSLNQALAGLSQYQQAVTTAQAQNGVTLQALNTAATTTSTQKNNAQAAITNATAVNMPAAITALNDTMTAVEASMKTFAEAQSLSLFKYL